TQRGRATGAALRACASGLRGWAANSQLPRAMARAQRLRWRFQWAAAVVIKPRACLESPFKKERSIATACGAGDRLKLGREPQQLANESREPAPRATAIRVKEIEY